MITQRDAHELKLFLWSELPKNILDKVSMELITEVNKVIDKAAGYNLGSGLKELRVS